MKSVIWGIVLLIFVAVSGVCQQDETLERSRALGLAYMEEDDFPNAVEYFEQAVKLAPDSAKDAANLGKSYYHAERFDDGIISLKRALELEPDNTVARYNLGLIYKTQGNFKDALPCFEEIAKNNAEDAALFYNLGLSLVNLGRNQEAIPWFEKTLTLDPAHTSAIYQLMLFAARNGQRDRSRELQKQFQEYKKNEAQRPPDAVDEGIFFGPLEYEITKQPSETPTSSKTSSEFTINTDWSNALKKKLDVSSTRVLASLPDLEAKQTDLVITSEEKTHIVRIDKNAEIISQKLIGEVAYDKCYPADFDNDKQLDLLFISPDKVVLFKNNGSGYDLLDNLFTAETDGVNDACWTDFDHEGDLDLFLARPNEGDLILQNNSDGSFKNVTETIDGLQLGNSYSITTSDYDFDNDLDIFQLTSDGNVRVFDNLREVRFKLVEDKPLVSNLDTTPYIRCFSFESNNSKQLVVFNAWMNEQLFRVNQEGEIEIPLIETPGYSPLSVCDFNNDGLLDVLHERKGNDRAALTIIHSPQNSILTKSIFTNQRTNQSVHSAIPADIDWDGDLDLLVNYDDGYLLPYENDLKESNKSILVKVNGEKNTSFGYGAKIQIKDGLFRAYREIQEPVTHIGVGNRDQVDVLRITWPNGIFQNEIHTAAASPAILNVSEKPGYAGSCPFIYTWDGEKFDFISDALSTGPLGLYVGGGFFPPRPEEYIRIRGDQMKPLDGEYHVRASEELREITYLDRLELLSASHPDAIEIHVNESFTLPPFPKFKLYGMSKQARLIARMVDNFGNDVTDLVKENDNRYPRPFNLDTHFEGVDHEYWFEIDLGDFDETQPVLLFMTGYVDWPNSSVARSLEQNPSLDFVMPYLQVKNESGEWETVKNPMGFPAGKLKTVPLDLSGLFKTNDHTVRIVSTLMVHWDRIWVDPAPITEGFKIITHEMTSADFRFGGYSRMYDLAGVGPHWYDYSQRNDNQRWSFNVGDYTRFGDVHSLLTDFDDHYVIMAPGDEVAATFDASNQQKAANLTYFLHLHGWVKDADISTAHSVTVEPLPFKEMGGYPYGDDKSYPLTAENLEYLLEYNTRTITGPNEPMRVPKQWKATAPAHRSRGLSQR
ncbi:MAG: tetratricopeptide repeat protein [Candidatus Hinthialibacter antarcticus]|nr:tetratricopeptide repeat protein [Candidatus Hinthialibacter antarcticus]